MTSDVQSQKNLGRRKVILFGAFDSFFWGAYAAFVGYITTYMLTSGMSKTVLSLEIAGYQIGAFAGSFFWGRICDFRRTNRKVFLIVFPAASVLAYITFFQVHNHLWITQLLYPFQGFVLQPVGSVVDAWMLRSFHNNTEMYGKARSAGSVGYALVYLLCGVQIRNLGYQIIPVFITLFTIPTLVMALVLKEETYTSKTVKKQQAGGNVGRLFHLQSYRIMLLILFFTGLSIAPLNNMLIVVLESVGGDVGILGVLGFVGVMVQAILIAMAGTLRKINPYVRLAITSCCMFFACFFMLIAQSSWFVVLGSVMSNICYGLALPTSRQITESQVPEELWTTGYSLSDAVYGNLCGVVAMLYGGWMMDAFDFRAVALLGTGIMLFVTGLSFFTVRNQRRSVQKFYGHVSCEDGQI